MTTRRSVLKGSVSLLGAPFINRARLLAGTTAAGTTAYSVRTLDLVRQSTVIDMLGLLTLDYKKLAAWRAPDGFQPAELQRLKNSGVTIFHPAVGFTDG